MVGPGAIPPDFWGRVEALEAVLSLAAVVIAVIGFLKGWWKALWRRLFAQRATAAAALVYHERKVLLVHRRPNPRGLTWQLPAGTVNPGDEPAGRASTEVLEETGVTCEVISKIGDRIHPRTGVHVHYFACSYVGGTATNLDPGENDRVEWVDAREVANRFGPEIYDKVLAFLKEL